MWSKWLHAFLSPHVSFQINLEFQAGVQRGPGEPRRPQLLWWGPSLTAPASELGPRWSRLLRDVWRGGSSDRWQHLPLKSSVSTRDCWDWVHQLLDSLFHWSRRSCSKSIWGSRSSQAVARLCCWGAFPRRPSHPLLQQVSSSRGFARLRLEFVQISEFLSFRYNRLLSDIRVICQH